MSCRSRKASWTESRLLQVSKGIESIRRASPTFDDLAKDARCRHIEAPAVLSSCRQWLVGVTFDSSHLNTSNVGCSEIDLTSRAGRFEV